MRSILFALLLLTIGAQARDLKNLRRRTVTTTTTSSPPAKTQSGIPCNCNNYTQVVVNDTCAGIVSKNNGAFTLNNFYAWNPAVGTSCNNLWVGYYVCIGVNAAAPSTCASTSPPTTSASASISSSSSSSLITPTSSASYSILQVSSSSTSTSSSTVSSGPPTPTQSGLASNCNRYYQVRGGDSCDTIRAKFATTITLQNILTWNPGLGSNCTNLFVNYFVCVGVPWQTNAMTFPSATSQYMPGWTASSLPPIGTSIAVPSPVQSGVIANCQGFYAAQKNDTCSSIAKGVGYLTVTQLELWNPALGSDCSGLQVGYYYCVENSTAIRAPPKVSGSPSPVQSGISPSCTAYYQAPLGSTVTCDIIVDMFGAFNQASFFAWNPALNSNCSALIPGDYYCVGVPGTPTTRTSSYSPTLWTPGMSTSTTSVSTTSSTPSFSTTSSKPSASNPSSTSLLTTSKSTVTNATPTPLQSGLVSGCNRFCYIETGDTCYNIAQQAGIALSDFYSWNPAVKTDCSGLQAHVYVCIGLTGPPMTITSGTPLPATPTPVQTAMVSSCARFYKVESGDGCYSMAQQAGIALTDFYAWNPAVKTDCSGLQAGVYVCIGLKGSATTISTGTPVPAVSTSTA